MSWQDRIDDEPVVINNHTYFGPHKWIVCLLGSDRYDVSNFTSDNKKVLQFSANLSISMMALTE